MSLALFDLDNTLINGDSDHAWGLYLAEIGVVDAEEHAQAQDQFYADYLAGKLDINVFLEFQLRPLKEHPLDQLNAWREEFIQQKIHPMIEDKRVSLVEKHRQQNDDIVIITATNSFITRPIADIFGIDTLIATEPEQNIHGFTGKVDGVPCFQTGKITKLNEWLADQDLSLENSWFYSDSNNDLPLLQHVTNPVCVTPDDTLRAHAESQGWPIID